jgi:hypothetical protein
MFSSEEINNIHVESITKCNSEECCQSFVVAHLFMKKSYGRKLFEKQCSLVRVVRESYERHRHPRSSDLRHSQGESTKILEESGWRGLKTQITQSQDLILQCA